MSREKDMTRTISMRVKESNLHIIERAATFSGQNRTEFFLESALNLAKEIFLSRTHFSLDEEKWSKLNTILDSPAKDKPELRKLLQTKAPWEQ